MRRALLNTARTVLIHLAEEALVALTGRSCPMCRARPMRAHRSDCPIGHRDGGVWA